jgi:hypothetical protein
MSARGGVDCISGCCAPLPLVGAARELQALHVRRERVRDRHDEM